MAGLRFTAAQERWTTKIGLAFVVALLIVVITQEDILKLGIIQRLELASIDYRFQSRGRTSAMKDSGNVIIVEISEESFKSLPEKWPWPRSYYARLIRNLKAAGAKAVGIDIILKGNDAFSLENDEELRAAIKESGIVVLAGKTEVRNDLYMHTTLTQNYGNIFFDVDSSLGIVNIRNDADGVYRRYSPFFGTNSGLRVPTFGFAVLNKYFGFPALTTAENFSDEFVFANRSIPKYDPASLLINFYGPSGTFLHIKFADVIDDERFETIEEAETGAEINTFSDPEFGYLYDGTFKNKIVLVGSTVPEDHDLFPIATARGEQSGDNLMYGVEIHANVIENVLRGQFIRKQSTLTEILAIFLFTITTFFVTSALKNSKTRHHFLVEVNGFLFTLAEIFIIGYAALTLFNDYLFLVTAISPTIAVLGGYFSSTAYHFVVERKQRMLIKGMFSTYVNPSVVDELITNPEKLTLGGERKELSVLFSDLVGFTTLSEGIPPEQLVGLLNEYLSSMTQIIFKNNGTLDKYDGDAVMAFWGAPIPQHDHALRACLSALQMQQALAQIRRVWREQNRPLFRARIGINTGEMIVGNTGGTGRFDYTVIGDSVNLASRLEGANKQYKTGIMVSQQTYDLVKDKILGRELDLMSVKGRLEPLKTFELLQELNGTIDPALEQFLESYTEALRLYKGRRWADARRKFEEALSLRPHDQPTHLYVERTTLYESNPPPEDWNGVFVLETK
ncbi:MAG: adenylate/guanylate cyclase domain-containing protein [Ignavibacteria bacterium]|nr:adenylate/guanylate cyclase domain-containing protein [Ignavibacteria bacterium]